MGLETGTYLNDLVTTNPDGAVDPKSAGDDHLRLIKSTLKATFPGMAGAAWRRQAKSGDYTLAATDNLSIIDCSATLTLTGVAATVGAAWMVLVFNSSATGVVTMPGTVRLYPDEGCLISSDGSAFTHFFMKRHGEHLIGTQSTSAASTLTFTTGLTDPVFKAFRLVFRGSVSAPTMLWLRTGAGSIDTGANYSYFIQHATFSATSMSILKATSATAAAITDGVYGPGQSIQIDVRFQVVTSRIDYLVHHVVANVSNVLKVEMGGGACNVSGTLDRIQLLSLDANLNGNAYLYGLR